MNINKTTVVSIPDNYTFNFNDDPIAQRVTVNINGASPFFSFIVYSGDTYVAAGDYTQAKLTTDVATYVNALSS